MAGRINMPRIPLLVLCLVFTLHIQFTCSNMLPRESVYLHHRARRATPEVRVKEFLGKLQTEPMDLIILIERSRAVGRYYFTYWNRRLVSHVLRYYTKIGPPNVKLVVATFAKSMTVHINGMENNLIKCDIWKKHWDGVILNDMDAEWGYTGVKNAFEQSMDIFKDHGTPGNKRYIWLLTSGDYKASRDGDPVDAKKNLLQNDYATIIATKTGAIEGLEGQIRALLSSDEYFGGNYTEWTRIMKTVDSISDPPKLQVTNLAQQCYCDVTYGFETCGLCQTCSPCSGIGPTCVCQSVVGATLCPVKNVLECHVGSAKTGRDCMTNEPRCIKNACANGGICSEDGSGYKCFCPGYDPGRFCEIALAVSTTSTTTTTTTTTTMKPPTVSPSSENEPFDIVMIAAIAGGSGAFLILVLIISICLCCRRKKKPKTSEMATYTMSAGISVGTDDIEYSEIPSIPQNLPPRPNRPTAVIRPKPQPPPKPPKADNLLAKLSKPVGRVPSFLQSVPVPGREELTLPFPRVTDQGDDVGSVVSQSTYTNQRDQYHTVSSNTSQVGSTLREEDMDVYENADSKGMAGWDKYIQDLTTSSGLKSFAIIRFNSEAYSTTSTVWFLPTPDEMQNIYAVIKNKKKKAVISILNANYRVTKNDGRMLEAFSLGDSPDVLCVGMSKQYLTLGVKTDAENSGECYSEVKWVRDNLSKQGK